MKYLHHIKLYIGRFIMGSKEQIAWSDVLVTDADVVLSVRRGGIEENINCTHLKVVEDQTRS